MDAPLHVPCVGDGPEHPEADAERQRQLRNRHNGASRKRVDPPREHARVLEMAQQRDISKHSEQEQRPAQARTADSGGRDASREEIGRDRAAEEGRKARKVRQHTRRQRRGEEPQVRGGRREAPPPRNKVIGCRNKKCCDSQFNEY